MVLVVCLSRYSQTMEQAAGVEQQDDTFWDENSQMVLRRSGVARWRQVLADRATERAAHADEVAAFVDRLRAGPAARA
jgi:hypothetical protein